MDPMAVLQNIYMVAKLIYDHAQVVKANQAQCKRLYERISAIVKALQQLKEVPNTQTFYDLLKRFEACVTECSEFVKGFTQQSWVKQIFSANPSQDKFNELNGALSQLGNDLNLGLSIENLWNRKQDKEDQIKDARALLARQDEIYALQQQEMFAIQQLRLSQEEVKAVLEKQRQSMMMQFTEIVNHMREGVMAKEKPPIDPKLTIPFYSLQIDQKIGSGSFGVVYQGRWNGQEVAVKMLEGIQTEVDRNQFIREVQIMERLRSRKVTQFYGVCLEKGQMCLVMEYMEKGSLFELLKNEALARDRQYTIALDIAQGICFLHEKGIIHSDLKSANVLVDRYYQAKITDFGLAKTRASSIQTIKKVSCAYPWLAPEVFQERYIPNISSDVYSFGVILWEILTGRRPWDGRSDKDILIMVERGEREMIPETVPVPYANLIQRCWHQDVKQRPTMQNVVQFMQENPLRPPSPNAEALYALGLSSEKEKNLEKAREYYERSAQKGYAKAMTNLGIFLIKGVGGYTQNKEKAKLQFEQAAQLGHVRAQFNLAKMFELGDGVPKDLRQSLYWYEKAAKQGDMDAEMKVKDLKQILSRASKAVMVSR